MSGLISYRSEGIYTINCCLLEENVEKRCKIKLYIDKKNLIVTEKFKREKNVTRRHIQYIILQFRRVRRIMSAVHVQANGENMNPAVSNSIEMCATKKMVMKTQSIHTPQQHIP